MIRKGLRWSCWLWSNDCEMMKMPLVIGGPAKDPRGRKSRSLQGRWKGAQETGLQTGQAHCTYHADCWSAGHWRSYDLAPGGRQLQTSLQLRWPVGCVSTWLTNTWSVFICGDDVMIDGDDDDHGDDGAIDGDGQHCCRDGGVHPVQQQVARPLHWPVEVPKP